MRFADDVVIPCAVERPRPRARDVPGNHGSEAAFFENRAHVHMDQEQSDRDERSAGVNQNRSVANEAQAPRKSFRVPQADAGEQQKNYAVENSPEEKFLAKVETADRR